MKRALGVGFSLAFGLGVFSSQTLAAGSDIPHFVNYYASIAALLGGNGERLIPILGAVFVLLVCLGLGVYFKSSVERSLASRQLTPEARPSLRMFIEMVMDFVHGLTQENCGPRYRNFLPLIGTLFVFILVANLSGLVPGLPPATENFNTNLAMGLIVFLCYNFAGFKEHGLAYLKQFTGPFLVLAPLFIGIELVSHAVRPLSLAFRLLANIFSDHLLLGVFTGLAPLFIPVAFLFFGLLVSIIQSFVFALLTGIYINMAISHDH